MERDFRYFVHLKMGFLGPIDGVCPSSILLQAVSLEQIFETLEYAQMKSRGL